MLLRWLRTLSLRINAGMLLGLVLAASVSQVAVANGLWGQAALLSSIQAANNNAQSASNQANYYYQLAQREIQAGEVELGKRLLQRTLSLDPQHRRASEDLAKLDQGGVSIAASATLASNNPMEGLNADQLMGLGLARIDGGDYEGAKLYLEEALRRSETETQRRTIRSSLVTIASHLERQESGRQAILNANLSELEQQLQKAIYFLEDRKSVV